MKFWKRPESMGWGNIVLCISDLLAQYGEIQIHSSLLDVARGVDFGPCIHFVDTLSDDVREPRILINEGYRHYVHRNIPLFIRPSAEVQKRIDSFAPALEDVTCGLHIRRGAYSMDSANVGCHGTDSDGQIIPAYFASDTALVKFQTLVKDAPGKVFLASDSKEVKQKFRDLFGDKIVLYDVKNVVLTYTCDVLKNYDTCDDDRLDCYVEWFLLSMCPQLYITHGELDSSNGISTFGYAAGCYGYKDVHLISN
jgi:hypothetical protein